MGSLEKIKAILEPLRDKDLGENRIIVRPYRESWDVVKALPNGDWSFTYHFKQWGPQRTTLLSEASEETAARHLKDIRICERNEPVKFPVGERVRHRPETGPGERATVVYNALGLVLLRLDSGAEVVAHHDRVEELSLVERIGDLS